MAKELIMPDFLTEDADTIHERMLGEAPSDVSIVEGDFFWDNTRPTAEEKAELVQLKLQNILRLAFTQTSTGQCLEFIGERVCVIKNDATKATGLIKVKGVPGTVLEKGSLVATVGTDTRESIEFEFIETKVIDDTGIVHVNAKCIEEGSKGNALPNTIKVFISSINGVQDITNEEMFKGGTDIEDEEHFRERVIEAEQEESLSGADADYVRWAKEVAGVGYAYPLSLWNGPGTVKVLILDKNGLPASKELIDRVQDYIAPIVLPGENRGGKAPTGAIVTIDTPSILNINVKSNFIFMEGYNPSEVLNRLKDKIGKYLSGIKFGGTVMYKALDTIVGSFLLENQGIQDYTNLTINDGTSNIKLVDQVPIIGEVINIVDIA